MILEIVAIYLVVQCSGTVVKLMRRRMDVFHYVTRP